jgi:CheY-like chemotaxis protein
MAMNRFRVLVMGPQDRLPSDLESSIHQDSRQEMVAEIVPAVSEALSRIGNKGYDAAVCWAERMDELAGVIRIRKDHPDLPIMVLTDQEEPGFADLARQAGATRTVQVGRSAASVSAHILQAVQSGDLRRELLKQVRWVRSQGGEIRALTKANRELTQSARTRAQGASMLRAPLLVEDNPDQALLMARAFEAAAIAAPLPIFRSGEEAIAFLSSEESYAGLDPIQPFSFALLDVDLPGISGLDLLEWMSREPRVKDVPVVMLSSSTEPDHIHRAFHLGAKSYLIKPSGFDALVRLVEGVHRFWSVPESSGSPSLPPQ